MIALLQEISFRHWQRSKLRSLLVVLGIALGVGLYVATEAANVGKALASIGKLIGILNIFLGMVGGPEVPDLSNLAGRPLDEVVPPIDAIVKTLRDVRNAVPVP